MTIYPIIAQATARTVAERVAGLDWPVIAAEADAHGCALTGPLLSSEECSSLADGYATEDLFRSRVNMAAHGFGLGEYRYYAYPLPPLVAELRESFYPPMAAVANGWAERLGSPGRYPADLSSFLDRCHAAGQTRPTPLLLQYEAGGYNCLHQDLYGDQVFPLQITILLSEPGAAFTGGEFVLTEQRPRMQSRAEVVALSRGEAVIFPVNQRPVQGSRGVYRVAMRHGVSRLRSGQRHTLGIIFHDAR